MKHNVYVVAIPSLFILTACASGGGGGGSASFLGVPAGTTSDPAELTNSWSSSSQSGVSMGSDTATISVGADNKPTHLTIHVPGEPTFMPRNTDYTLTAPGATSLVYTGTSSDLPGSTAYVLDPAQQQWNYQSVGLVVLPASGENARSSYAFSGGWVTSNLPTTGTATYTGKAIGDFVPSNSAATLFIADMTATANFGAGTLSWATSNTRTGDNVLQTPASGTLNPSLNMSFSGSPTVLEGSGGVSAPITNSAGTLSGTMYGRAYGPNAEEIGGAFYATGSLGRLAGAFGGKR